MKLNVKIKINVERKLINTEAHTFRSLDYTKFVDKSTATTIVVVPWGPFSCRKNLGKLTILLGCSENVGNI